MELQYRQAFSEVYEIFKLMPQALLNKIPKKFYNIIEDERDKDYIVNIKEPLEEQRLKTETTIILGLIYRDFLCPQEERKKLQKKDAVEIKKVQEKLEKEKHQKYDPNQLFKRVEQIKDEHITEEVNMVEYKKSFFSKIKEWIKAWFM